MPNIYGPDGAGTRASLTRPEVPTPLSPSTDTWFAPCINGDPNTGTRFTSAWANFITANLRRAIRGMGVAEDPADDDMLLKAIQAAASSGAGSGGAGGGTGTTPPIFPEILTAGKTLAFTTGTGSVVLSTGQSWLWRGVRTFDATDLSVSERTVTTSANKTYHLRWHASGTGSATPAATYPNGRLALKDIADATYNPTSAAEYDPAFDSSYDDMLIARVVTNGSNVPTVTALANMVRMAGSITAVARTSSGAETDHVFNFTLALARTPRLALFGQTPPGGGYDSDYDIRPNYVRREAVQIYSWSWHHAGALQSPGFSYNLID